MLTLRVSILLIFLLGVAAGAAGLWDRLTPEARAMVSGPLVKLLLLGTGGGALFFVSIRLFRSPKSNGSGYSKPKVIGARVGDGIGDLTVAAGHSADVSRELRLPAGSRIVTVTANQLYRVDLPSSERSIVEAVARENGYRGPVGS